MKISSHASKKVWTALRGSCLSKIPLVPTEMPAAMSLTLAEIMNAFCHFRNNGLARELSNGCWEPVLQEGQLYLPRSSKLELWRRGWAVRNQAQAAQSAMILDARQQAKVDYKAGVEQRRKERAGRRLTEQELREARRDERKQAFAAAQLQARKPKHYAATPLVNIPPKPEPINDVVYDPWAIIRQRHYGRPQYVASTFIKAPDTRKMMGSR